MTSEPARAFVWAWLPGAQEPVVAGRLDLVDRAIVFTYDRGYLGRGGAIPIYLPELPLGTESITPKHEVHGCIVDAAPDSWGRRVILNKRVGGGAEDTTELDLLTYLLDSGSDRIGALDFQESPEEYAPRTVDDATLSDLAESAQRVEEGVPLSEDVDEALLRRSSIGGARPKALLDDRGRRLIAKFSVTGDPYPVIEAEFVAMRLAQLAGLEVAKVEMTEASGKKVLLVKRFDRTDGGGRRAMISALTMLGLGEYEARYASYADLAEVIRTRFTDPDRTLRELFSRITFNILTSNNDDHARNQAAFWDGRELTLTPAYDICPQPRAGGETQQVMAIGSDGWRMSQLAGCVERSETYGLSPKPARKVIDRQIAAITDNWGQVCDEAGLTRVEREGFWNRQFLNPYATQGY